MTQLHSTSKSHYDMERFVAILSYCTIVGWFVAIVIYGKHKSTFSAFHLRQSLGLGLTAAILSIIPLIGWLLCVVILFAWLTAMYYAFIGEKHLVPFLGEYYQSHFDFIRD